MNACMPVWARQELGHGCRVTLVGVHGISRASLAIASALPQLLRVIRLITSGAAWPSFIIPGERTESPGITTRSRGSVRGFGYHVSPVSLRRATRLRKQRL